LFCFVLYTCGGVWHNKQSLQKPLGPAASQMVESISCYSRHPPQWTNLIDDGGSTWTIAKKTKRFSLSLHAEVKLPPCLARLMIDSLETALYNGIFSPTQLNVSLEGHAFSLHLHFCPFSNFHICIP
jgi:hypothetical protein